MDVVEEPLRKFVDALDRCAVPYMLTGSFASGYYGNGRSTQDIDFVIMPTREQLRALIELLGPPEFYVDERAAMDALRQRGQFNVIDVETAFKADFIVQKARSFSEEEFRRRVPAVIAGVPVMVATAEDSIVSKLEWSTLGGSLRQLEDAASVLMVRGSQIDRAYVEEWVRKLDLGEQWAAALRLAGS